MFLFCRIFVLVLARYLPFQNIHGPYTCDGEYRAMYSGSKFTDGEQTMFGYITEMDTKVRPHVLTLGLMDSRFPSVCTLTRSFK